MNSSRRNLKPEVVVVEEEGVVAGVVLEEEAGEEVEAKVEVVVEEEEKVVVEEEVKVVAAEAEGVEDENPETKPYMGTSEAQIFFTIDSSRIRPLDLSH
jgi:hypothetical protein